MNLKCRQESGLEAFSRLAAMGRPRAASIICAVAAALALGLSACGGSDAKLLPGKTADQINQNLDQVRAFVDEGDCAGAEDAVGEVSEEVDSLGGVDQKLKAALRQGTHRLGEVVSSCGEKAEAEAEQEAEEDEIAEQEEQAAVEAEEDELEAEEEQAAKEKVKKVAPKESQEAEEGGATEPPESGGPKGEEHSKGPPAETPSGTEPPAGGVGPGSEVE
jgi:hypothetical protein